jgi:acyl-CoA thioesterase-1
MLSAISRILLILWLSLAPLSARAMNNILIFGDSLSAGYGIQQNQSWPALLNDRLTATHRPYTVINASISGETTAGGLSRLPAELRRSHPTVLVIALGANDGLRGLPANEIRDNLRKMIQLAKAAGIRILLIGMKLPTNYGPDYTARFEQVFRDLAKSERVGLLPFLLAPVALDRLAFQSDGLHPTAAAQTKLLEHIWPALDPLLK